MSVRSVGLPKESKRLGEEKWRQNTTFIFLILVSAQRSLFSKT